MKTHWKLFKRDKTTLFNHESVFPEVTASFDSVVIAHVLTSLKHFKEVTNKQEVHLSTANKKKKKGGGLTSSPKLVVQLKASAEPEPKMLSPANICKVHKQSFEGSLR